MVTRISHLAGFARAMGARFVAFRILFEIKRRYGWLKRAFPVDPVFRTWITLDSWRSNAPAFFFSSRNALVKNPAITPALRDEAARVFDREVQFFKGEWKRIAPNDWLTNPLTGHRYDANLHWTEIPDFHPSYGDIKYVWEKSRFLFLQTVLRYDLHSGSDSSEWVFTQIESWISHNPVNRGPNYRCSQEISIRVFNWILALYFYSHSSNLTEERFNSIVFNIYWQLRHVRSNIHFSRIAVRNNHAVTETLALYTAGLLFPFFPEAGEWKAVGKKWFEEEIAYQIYEDGSYLQFSHNYHRIVVQLLTWGISLARLHGESFEPAVYQRAMASLSFLLHSQDAVSGMMPNYGANDGALFFKWNDSDARDFRPTLDCLHFLLSGENIYSDAFEDRVWFGARDSLRICERVSVREGASSFPQGGIHVFRSAHLLVRINCPPYRNRPLQADHLHLDVWYKGQNVLPDGGSYQYNTSAEKVKYFSGTESHNTVMLGEHDQMMKGPRFMWMRWPRTTQAGWKGNSFSARALVYRHLGEVVHERTVTVEPTRIVVADKVEGGDGVIRRQLWHLPTAGASTVQLCANGDSKRVEREGFHSPTYGSLCPCRQIEFQTMSDTLKTEIIFS